MSKIDKLNTKILNISVPAKDQMIKILSRELNGSFVRLSVDSGGCSGFSYKFSIDNDYNKNNDIQLIKDKETIIFVTDIISLRFIENSTIDWIETLSSSQFTVENPLATARCGCGTSFSV